MIDRKRLLAPLLALAAVVAAPAGAQVLYKLIDPQGRVTYTDSEPKKYDGKVIRIEPPDAAPTLQPPVKAAADGEKAGAGSGLAQKRRQTREDLDQKLRTAQSNAEAARKAKSEGADPLPGELQTIQHRYPVPRRGDPMPRPNCFVTTSPAGVSAVNCPTQVPGETYYQRQKKLEDELARAEEELTLAERAYRRGTD